MSDEPTADQIRAYLTATGWTVGDSGRAAAMWVRRGASVRILHEPTDYDLDKAVLDISIAEKRHPADVRDDILDVDNPIHARIHAWAISSMCERAAENVRDQVEEAGDNGWPGAWNADVAYAMSKSAAVLADALNETAAVIRAAVKADPAIPWHPLWTAAGRAAETIVLAEPATPDDLEELKRRFAAGRIEMKETNR